ncbi:MAG: hypothetical protein A3F67_05070 [Verrucomicrobia bacterium RIFCSPHIGHO2_12_FULL_41_10]|nr:MAG: hypothetical protein A3F67_05070 [Verrucomicrobia bacterium RIFCSPHIGHO2_12_FULL_41_10]HLB33473.1 hypothetical protein [Chthoniobacterales bacterium]
MKTLTLSILLLSSLSSNRLFADLPPYGTVVAITPGPQAITKDSYIKNGGPICIQNSQQLTIIQPFTDGVDTSILPDILHLNTEYRGRDQNNKSLQCSIKIFTATSPGEATIRIGNNNYIVDVVEE